METSAREVQHLLGIGFLNFLRGMETVKPRGPPVVRGGLPKLP